MRRRVAAALALPMAAGFRALVPWVSAHEGRETRWCAGDAPVSAAPAPAGMDRSGPLATMRAVLDAIET
jgi:hypothetical protein